MSTSEFAQTLKIARSGTFYAGLIVDTQGGLDGDGTTSYSTSPSIPVDETVVALNSDSFAFLLHDGRATLENCDIDDANSTSEGYTTMPHPNTIPGDISPLRTQIDTTYSHLKRLADCHRY
jgi:hypothetical protein